MQRHLLQLEVGGVGVALGLLDAVGQVAVHGGKNTHHAVAVRTAALGRVWPGDGCGRWLSRVFEAEVHCALEAFVAVAEFSPGQSL